MNIERVVLTVCLAVFVLQFSCGGSEDPQPTAEATPPQIAEPITQAPAEVVEPPSAAGPYDGEDAAFLTLNSKPWSTIYLDGKMVRNTPLKETRSARASTRSSCVAATAWTRRSSPTNSRRARARRT